MVVPGATFVILLGALSAHGYYEIWCLGALSVAGSFIGDVISYEFGRKNSHVTDRWQRIHRHVPRARLFFDKFGHFGIIFGRFFGWTRPLVPFVAGVVGYPRAAFFPICFFSCVFWSVAYLGIGYAFGEAWRVALKWSIWAMAAVLIAAVVVWAAFWLWRYWMVLGPKRLLRVLRAEKEAVLEQKLPSSTVVDTAVTSALEEQEPPSWS